jgi:acyl-CoA synthetase (AMP-forming)/AMP-acid ligase II
LTSAAHPDQTWTSIPAAVFATIDRLGDAEAVIDGDVRLTFAELGDRIRRSAAAMLAAGVGHGDRVAIWAPNGVRWIVAALGLHCAGATLVPINTRFKGTEAGHVLRSSGARLLLTANGFLGIDSIGMLADVELPALAGIVVLSGDVPGEATSWDEFLAGGSGVSDAEVDARIAAVGPDDVCDIIFTSGTTGTPKGVMMAHGQTLRQFNDWCDFADLREGDRYLIVNPFFHMFGYKAGWLACLMRGATVLPVAVFDVGEALSVIESERVTVFPGPPTLYQAILDHPGLERSGSDAPDLSSLRVAVTGAADIPVDLIRRIRDELPFERILTGYGLTEAGTVTGTRPEDDAETIATTAGRPMPGIEVRILEGGVEVGRGETGEVVVRGYNVMSGYFNDPESTRAAVDAEGWMHTGDLGTMDDMDYVRIVGRIKDLFIVGGFNAYPAEIENLLLTHPGIARAAVIGVPDERMGEVGRAFVVVAGGMALDPEEVIAWSRTHMANYKVPRSVIVLDELPLNATGKVMKEELRNYSP